MAQTNYAQALGIHNKWAPIVFAALYFLLMIYYTVQAMRRHRDVYGGLAFFSAVRVVAYSLRAAMANRSKDANSKGVAIAYEVLYSVGFFSLLLSTYNLLHDRTRLARLQRGASAVSNELHKGRIVRMLIHLLVFIAVVLGTVGIVYALGNSGHTGLGNGLNGASTYIFLAVAVIIAILTILLIIHEMKLRRNTASTAPPIGASHHHLILLIVAALLLLRTLFYAVTVHNRLRGGSATSPITHSAQANEKLWYPLAALAELLIAALFLVPALVPLRSSIARHAGRCDGVNEKSAYGGQEYNNAQEYNNGTGGPLGQHGGAPGVNNNAAAPQGEYGMGQSGGHVV